MLALREIKKEFIQPTGERVEILDVPQYDVKAGEQAVLIGASGGGKSTLLHIISGITNPTSGKVIVDGVELTSLSEAGRDRVRADLIGYIFQTFNLLPGFTALENVQLGMAFASGKKRESGRAKELLAKVGLSHRMNNYPKTLSVGEQQRVAVARALANRPRLLLADEPTANVDPANQQNVIDLIRSSCEQEKIALVIVTHAMEVANQFSRIDRLENINRVLQRTKVTS